MLLTDFQEVIKIDEQINALHRQLSTLYNKRNFITTATTLESPPADNYKSIRESWQKYSISIPARARLKSRLDQAESLLNELNSLPRYDGKFELFLLPPSSKIMLPDFARHRATQEVSSYPDFISPELPKPDSQKDWKLYLVYGGRAGLTIADFEAFMRERHYAVAGKDMSGLTVRGYALYTLMKDFPVDEHGWSLLPAAKTSNAGSVACAGFVDGRYRFLLDETAGLLGQNSFRPAMEIK